MNAYLFNPENDLALAAGTANYTPPKNALLLSNCGRLLPIWYAAPESAVLAKPGYESWVNEVCDTYGLDVTCSDTLPQNAICFPWGWSMYAARIFNNAGVTANSLPTDDALSRLRNLSHRRISISVVQALRRVVNFEITKIATEAKSAADVVNYAKNNGTFYFKSPWSSTGRGVALSSSMSAEEVLRRCEGIISRQGSVMLEPSVNKVQDFAILFYSDAGKVTHIGYSYFSNEGNSYSSNVLVDDSEILSMLSRYVPREMLESLADNLQCVLTEIIGDAYTGYFGVDMMIYEECGAYKIDVCTEVNLRMTMGVLAWIWNKRFMASGVKGILSVTYGSDGIDCNRIVEAGKLVSGTQYLVPPGQQFSITVNTI